MSTSGLDRLRQPEYTGENRCIPCTCVNVVITVLLSLVAGYAWAITVGPFAWLVGGAVLAAGLTAVWLRGYIVPGTPQLTKQYFPDWLLRLFDKDPAAAAPGGIDTGDAERDTEAPDGANAEELLLSAGVVAPCEHEDDLCLSEQFRTAWHERRREIREEAAERDGLARELDIAPSTIEFEEHGDAFVAYADDRRLGQWESRGALVADLAAARELPEWVDSWDALPVAARSHLLGGLRIFLDTCPICEGPVSAGRETVESCCRSREVVAATCEACDARMLEVTYPEPA